MIKVNCLKCGKEINQYPSQNRKYCSAACQDSVKTSKMVKCAICNNEFRLYRCSSQRYCSQKCANKDRIKLRPKIPCPVCNKEFIQQRKDHKYCSRKCQLTVFKKECVKPKIKITALRIDIRNLYKYDQWRQAVRKRDNYTCTRCGNPGLETHHDIPFISLLKKYNIKTLAEAIACKELWDINNGTTVCLACHWLMHPRIKARDNNIVNKREKYAIR